MKRRWLAGAMLSVLAIGFWNCSRYCTVYILSVDNTVSDLKIGETVVLSSHHEVRGESIFGRRFREGQYVVHWSHLGRNRSESITIFPGEAYIGIDQNGSLQIDGDIERSNMPLPSSLPEDK